MARNLDEILKETPEDEEQIRRLIDRVLDRQRKPGEDNALFGFGDLHFQKTDGDCMVKSIGEALLHIYDANAFGAMQYELDVACTEAHGVADGKMLDRNYDNWILQYIKQSSWALINMSKTEKNIKGFLKLKLKDYYSAMDTEVYSPNDPDRMLFEKMAEDRMDHTLGEILREALDEASKEWNMTYCYYDQLKRYKKAIRRISFLVFWPLLIYYTGRWDRKKHGREY